MRGTRSSAPSFDGLFSGSWRQAKVRCALRVEQLTDPVVATLLLLNKRTGAEPDSTFPFPRQPDQATHRHCSGLNFCITSLHARMSAVVLPDGAALCTAARTIDAERVFPEMGRHFTGLPSYV
jgi:hypothetical protein